MSPFISEHTMFENIMDSSLDSLYFKDKDFRFIFVNKNKAIRHGIQNPSDMYGKTDFEFFAEKDAIKIFEVDKSIFDTGRPIVGRIEKLTRLDGETTWSSTSKYPLYDKTGAIIGIWGISRDITDYELAKEELRESQERYSQLSEQSRTFTWEVDERGLYTYADHVAEIVLGFRPDELIHKKHFYDLCPEGEREGFKIAAFEVFKRKEHFQNLENKAMTKDGKPVWLSTNGLPVLKDDGTLDGYRGSDTDITERKHTEDALKESEEKFRAYTEKAPLGIFVADSTGRYIEVNPAGCRMSGYGKEELLKLSIPDLLPPEHLEAGLKIFTTLITQGYAEGDVLGRRKNGDRFWFNLVSIKIAENRLIAFCKDITDQKEAEKEILYLSYHDQLTGLYNRRFYEEELKRLDTKRNFPLTIAMGDVNGLKLINDSFGHDMGDELLKKAAALIKQCCRSDDIIARLGGDEFVILLPKTDILETEKIIARIKNLSAKEKVCNINISISFGCKTKNKAAENIQEVFKNAEDHMYRNKLSESPRTRNETIEQVMNTLYEKYGREKLHSIRVSEICEDIASKMMDFDKDDVAQLKIAGLMHDIGKIEIDGKILNKSTGLDMDEWEAIKRHSEIGYRILNSISEYARIADYVLEHHERWDGKGYPRGLKGDEISIQARVIAVADSYDAMTTNRTYCRTLDAEEAITEIKKCSGTQFDPAIAQVFVEKVLGGKWDA